MPNHETVVSRVNPINHWVVDDPHSEFESNNSSYDDDTEDEPSDDFRDDEHFGRHVKPSEFPIFELPIWGSMRDRDNAVNIWQSQMSYRLRWIFQREEREGVNRCRLINPFSPADFKQRIEKTSQCHEMDTDTSTFYDWRMGDSDFLLRMESFEIDNNECLRCHFVHKPTGKELCYQDRAWDGSYYLEVNITWASC